MAVRLDEIRRAAERVAASHGLDVVDLEFAGSEKERTLRVALEKNAAGRAQWRAELAAAAAGGNVEHLPERLVEGSLSVEQLSGITHEDCAAFSRDLGTLLDVEDLVPGGEYTLEATSPGLDRKLSRPQDFDRFAGCLVKVRTFEPIRNNRHWQGRLLSGSGPSSETGRIVLDLGAVKQNSKTRKAMGTPGVSPSPGGKKAGVSTVEIDIGNIEKANLVPEI
ncbi:MAG: ribosome maturation factor RimP [Acidobacteriota bacterium]